MLPRVPLTPLGVGWGHEIFMAVIPVAILQLLSAPSHSRWIKMAAPAHIPAFGPRAGRRRLLRSLEPARHNAWRRFLGAVQAGGPSRWPELPPFQGLALIEPRVGPERESSLPQQQEKDWDLDDRWVSGNMRAQPGSQGLFGPSRFLDFDPDAASLQTGAKSPLPF